MFKKLLNSNSPYLPFLLSFFFSSNNLLLPMLYQISTKPDVLVMASFDILL